MAMHCGRTLTNPAQLIFSHDPRASKSSPSAPRALSDLVSAAPCGAVHILPLHLILGPSHIPTFTLFQTPSLYPCHSFCLECL